VTEPPTLPHTSAVTDPELVDDGIQESWTDYAMPRIIERLATLDRQRFTTGYRLTRLFQFQ